MCVQKSICNRRQKCLSSPASMRDSGFLSFQIHHDHEEEEMRRDVVSRIEAVIKDLWPMAKVSPAHGDLLLLFNNVGPKKLYLL